MKSSSLLAVSLLTLITGLLSATSLHAQYNAVFKEKVLVQTKNGVPAAATGDVWNPAPYNFQCYSPIKAGTVKGPTGRSYKLEFIAEDNQYEYVSEAVKTTALLNSLYPDGSYTLANAAKVTLTGDVYPNIPQLTSVNGKAPVWNSKKQVVIKASVANKVVWTAFSTSTAAYHFSNGGFELVEVQGDNIDSQQAAFGPAGEKAFDTLTLPAHSLVAGHTYIFVINYFLASYARVGTSATTTDAAGYNTETYLTVVAE